MKSKKRKFLTKEEEIKLGYDILAYRNDKDNIDKKNKAIEAVHKLFLSNEYFAVNKAINFLKVTQAKNYLLEDAQIDAKIGLLRAIWNYDPRRNTKITTVANMPIFKELSMRYNFDESPVSFQDWSNVTYARAKREWEKSGTKDSLLEFIKNNSDKYDNIDKRFNQIENVLIGLSSLDYVINDDSGKEVLFKDVVADENVDVENDVISKDNQLFSNELNEYIDSSLTPLQKEIITYEYDDNSKEKQEDFLKKHNITKRKYTIELKKSINILKEEMMTENKIAIIGAGLTGSFLARELAEKYEKVVVFEAKNHVGGHIYDYIDEKTGCLVHKYGPHIFHTSNDEVWNWANKYSKFNRFELRNKIYIKELDKWLDLSFGTHTAKELLSEEEYIEYLKDLVEEFPGRVSVSVPELLKANSPIIKKFANLLWEYDYKPYTSKQWGLSPDKIDPTVLKRVPVYSSHYNRYFTDTYEGLPEHGYTKWIENILNHENIKVLLEKEPKVEIIDNKCFVDGKEYKKVIYTGPVDKLFNYKHGDLSYRTLKFEFFENDMPKDMQFGMPCVHLYPNLEYNFTRITHYGLLPLQPHLEKQISAKEYSIKYDKNISDMTPYYPINTEEDKEIHKNYQKELENVSNLIVAGRLGNYKYYNMDKAIEDAMKTLKEKF